MNVVAYAVYAPCGCLIAAFAANLVYLKKKYESRTGYRVVPSETPVQLPGAELCDLHQKELDVFNRATSIGRTPKTRTRQATARKSHNKQEA